MAGVELRAPGAAGGRQWLATPLPALGGLTPREAIKTAEGRAEVIELLKTVDYMETVRKGHADQIPYDRTWLLDELGLERLSPDRD